jgi:predicted PurR-regulated permease PerM
LKTQRLVPYDPPLSLAQKVVRTFVFLCIAAIVVVILWVLRFLVAPVVLAVLLVYILGPLVNLMENRRVPRGVAVGICFLVLFGVLVGVSLAVWPSLESWLRQSPSPGETSVFEDQLAKRLAAWEESGRAAYPQIRWHEHFAKLQAVLDGQRRRLMETLPILALDALSSAGTFVLAPIIALFLLLDGAGMRRAIIAFVPNRYFETVLLLIHRVDRQIAYYLRGAASESALVAVLLSIVLALAGMPNAILFGVLFGVLNVIPIVGPIIGASAGLLYSLVDANAPSMAVLGACYGLVYVLDAMLINPMVVGKNLNLHPLTIIVGISIGGGLGGILGMLVSIPTIAVGKAIIGTLLDAWQRRRLARLT